MIQQKCINIYAEIIVLKIHFKIFDAIWIGWSVLYHIIKVFVLPAAICSSIVLSTWNYSLAACKVNSLSNLVQMIGGRLKFIFSCLFDIFIFYIMKEWILLEILY